MIYPWHLTLFQRLQQLHTAQKLPHALLFCGMAGVGKKYFALQLAKYLLCQNPLASLSKESCDCSQCRLVAQHTHTNLFHIHPEKSGAFIKIDQIRELVNFLQNQAGSHEYHIALIEDAEQMNAHAANALLKTLEEPGNRSLIILISNQEQRLPATILSRCQRYHFKKPPHEIALAWLKQVLPQENVALLLDLAEGAPLLALELFQSDLIKLRQNIFNDLIYIINQEATPLTIASQWVKHELMPLINLMWYFTRDLLRLATEGKLINQDFSIPMQAMNLTLTKILTQLNQLQLIRKQLLMGFNPNKQLTLERILIDFSLLSLTHKMAS